MQQGPGEREYQLLSAEQAQMDFWANQVRECYREMTAIAMRRMQKEAGEDTEIGQPLGEQTEEKLADSFRDQEVVWPLDEKQECCYRKDGGQVVVRPRRQG
ncbi:hypothetical protein [Desmospora profundinema]|uniref:Uncharacterized protein n=1 Tax=Desmospora profundinema TaxID=1571184 RepID=A0ABU1INU5_9BACL|nr:hypothetical protein [Desmospora profundinema]MDR6226192.1 hypothetical protein [Desmospora profundinema]